MFTTLPTLTDLAMPAPASIEVALLFLLFAGATAIAGVGFVAWISFIVVRAVLGLVFGVVFGLPRLLLGGGRCRSRQPRTLPPVVAHVACPDPVCRGVNPGAARFCRQCGRPLTARLAALA